MDRETFHHSDEDSSNEDLLTDRNEPLDDDNVRLMNRSICGWNLSRRPLLPVLASVTIYGPISSVFRPPTVYPISGAEVPPMTDLMSARCLSSARNLCFAFPQQSLHYSPACLPSSAMIDASPRRASAEVACPAASTRSFTDLDTPLNLGSA